MELHNALGDSGVLPPKRMLTTSFLPSAWIDDSLITERKIGLSVYLKDLINSFEYRDSPVLAQFLATSSTIYKEKIDTEDVLPSSFSTNQASQGESITSAASPIAAAYYPDWSADSRPPESLDYSLFDILFFGKIT